jgi:hypothetical protein
LDGISSRITEVGGHRCIISPDYTLPDLSLIVNKLVQETLTQFMQAKGARAKPFEKPQGVRLSALPPVDEPSFELMSIIDELVTTFRGLISSKTGCRSFLLALIHEASFNGKDLLALAGCSRSAIRHLIGVFKVERKRGLSRAHLYQKMINFLGIALKDTDKLIEVMSAEKRGRGDRAIIHYNQLLALYKSSSLDDDQWQVFSLLMEAYRLYPNCRQEVDRRIFIYYAEREEEQQRKRGQSLI